MLVELSMFPLGKVNGLSEDVARVIETIESSGLDYRLTAMGTLIEGEWDEVIEVIGRCRQCLLENNERIYMVIKVDDHKAAHGKIEGKVTSVMNKVRHD